MFRRSFKRGTVKNNKNCLKLGAEVAACACHFINCRNVTWKRIVPLYLLHSKSVIVKFDLRGWFKVYFRFKYKINCHDRKTIGSSRLAWDSAGQGVLELSFVGNTLYLWVGRLIGNGFRFLLRTISRQRTNHGHHQVMI